MKQMTANSSEKWFRVVLFLCCIIWGSRVLAVEAAVKPEPLRVYYIGCSQIGSMLVDRLYSFFEQKGIHCDYGSTGGGGKTLTELWNSPKDKKIKVVANESNCPDGKGGWEPCKDQWNDPNPKRFGLYEQAFAKNTWDAVVMAPYNSRLHDDLTAGGKFIELTLKKSPKVKFYIFSWWSLRKVAPGGTWAGPSIPIDYQKAWLLTYAAGPEATAWEAKNGWDSRDYYQKLCGHLNERYKKNAEPIKIIPAGEVIFELDKAIKAGTLPGLKALFERSPKHLPGMTKDFKPSDGVNILYADTVHFSPPPHDFPSLGAFAGSMTIFSAISGKSPVGLSGATYGLDNTKDAELIAAIQEIVWKAVKEYSGIENLK